jgi:hypothetical protein
MARCRSGSTERTASRNTPGTAIRTVRDALAGEPTPFLRQTLAEVERILRIAE